MADYRTMFDAKWIKAWDLGGKEFTVEIAKVEAGFVEDKAKGTKDKRPIVWFKGAKKPFGCNKTNAQIIAGMYGNETKAWIGKSVTLFPTTCQAFGKTEDCIRIRPQVPKGKAVDMPNPEPPAEGAEHGQ
jgi:hypothetical protein